MIWGLRKLAEKPYGVEGLLEYEEPQPKLFKLPPREPGLAGDDPEGAHGALLVGGHDDHLKPFRVLPNEVDVAPLLGMEPEA